MKRISVLLVDDNQHFLKAATELVDRHLGMIVTASATNGARALALLQCNLVNLVLMDVNMPVMNGLDATRAIKSLAEPPRVILTSLDDSPHHAARARGAGADAFIPKGTLITDLPRIVDAWF